MKRDRDDTNIDTTDCLMLLSKIGHENFTNTNKSLVTGRSFTCKTCNKKFPSFQALGGHRASHKKPKFSGDDLSFKLSTSQPKPKLAHECPICGLDFPIGQALGGHMRKHKQVSIINKNMLRTKNTSSSVSNTSTVSTGEELATRDFSMAPEFTKKSSCIIFGVDFCAVSKEDDLKLKL